MIPSGPVLFARYAYPPNSLGYCGPGDPSALFAMAADGTDARGLTALASRFEGAWPYLQLIAASNGIDDPLDRQVVEAYWVGNGLLDRVPASTLIGSLDERFERRVGREFGTIADTVMLRAVPHHSFHVFAVYPWLGMLRAGFESPALTVLDRCRIRWGTVASVSGDEVVVDSRPLVLRGHRLELGGSRAEVARWSTEGAGLVHGLAPGDVVSLHWDWVCDRLTPDALRRLRRYTRGTMRAVNALPRPGHAVSCDAYG